MASAVHAPQAARASSRPHCGPAPCGALVTARPTGLRGRTSFSTRHRAPTGAQRGRGTRPGHTAGGTSSQDSGPGGPRPPPASPDLEIEDKHSSHEEMPWDSHSELREAKALGCAFQGAGAGHHPVGPRLGLAPRREQRATPGASAPRPRSSQAGGRPPKRRGCHTHTAGPRDGTCRLSSTCLSYDHMQSYRLAALSPQIHVLTPVPRAMACGGGASGRAALRHGTQAAPCPSPT